MAPPATTNESCESCGGNKRGVGAVVITFGGLNLIGLVICALFATDVPLYAGFGWLNVILSLAVLVVASLYSCQCCSDEACPARAVGGVMVPSCVLACISFIVGASGAAADASRTRDRVRGRGRVGLGGGGARRRASVGVEEEGREDADERSRVGGDVRARFGEGGEEGG